MWILFLRLSCNFMPLFHLISTSNYHTHSLHNLYIIKATNNKNHNCSFMWNYLFIHRKKVSHYIVWLVAELLLLQLMSRWGFRFCCCCNFMKIIQIVVWSTNMFLMQWMIIGQLYELRNSRYDLISNFKCLA